MRVDRAQGHLAENPAGDLAQMKRNAITQEQLQTVLSYSPETGEFRWLVSRPGTGGKGSVAGGVSAIHGYHEIRIDYVLYKAHRLAWLYVHGSFPATEIDHIDGCRSNNRLDNLRLASRSQNTANRRTARSDNILGISGVSKTKTSYSVRIMKDGRLYRLGTFPTLAEASSAYRAKHIELYGQFSPFACEVA